MEEKLGKCQEKYGIKGHIGRGEMCRRLNSIGVQIDESITNDSLCSFYKKVWIDKEVSGQQELFHESSKRTPQIVKDSKKSMTCQVTAEEFGWFKQYKEMTGCDMQTFMYNAFKVYQRKLTIAEGK